MPHIQHFGPSIHVGCSGWLYRHWRGDFYPAELPQNRWLEHYAEQFDTVEINNTFYRLPELKTFAEWRRRVHGPRRYTGRYSDHVIDGWGEWLAGRARAGLPVYAYFNNDAGDMRPATPCGCATRSGLELDPLAPWGFQHQGHDYRLTESA
jgi:uncharacterized protein YecE (DUF72 family)